MGSFLYSLRAPGSTGEALGAEARSWPEFRTRKWYNSLVHFLRCFEQLVSTLHPTHAWRTVQLFSRPASIPRRSNVLVYDGFSCCTTRFASTPGLAKWQWLVCVQLRRNCKQFLFFLPPSRLPLYSHVANVLLCNRNCAYVFIPLSVSLLWGPVLLIYLGHDSYLHMLMELDHFASCAV